MGLRPRISGVVGLAVSIGCAATTSWDDYDAKVDVGKRKPDGSTSSSSSSSGAPKDDGGAAKSKIDVLQIVSSGIEKEGTMIDVAPAKLTTEGSTMLVAVGWYNVDNDIESITDNVGGTYEIAAEPVSFTGAADTIWQKLFYASGMPGGKVYTLTVKWTNTVDTPDVRVAEVVGLDRATPFIKSKQSSGRAMTFHVGPLDVSGPGLVFAASTGEGTYQDCPEDFFACIVDANTGNLAEIKLLPTGGSFTATNGFQAADDFVMQAAAFH